LPQALTPALSQKGEGVKLYCSFRRAFSLKSRLVIRP